MATTSDETMVTISDAQWSKIVAAAAPNTPSAKARNEVQQVLNEYVKLVIKPG